MAKKNYQKIEAYRIGISSISSDKSIISLYGKNSKSTDIKITVVVEDYFFPHMIKDMALIGKQRVESANSINNRIRNAVNI